MSVGVHPADGIAKTYDEFATRLQYTRHGIVDTFFQKQEPLAVGRSVGRRSVGSVGSARRGNAVSHHVDFTSLPIPEKKT